MKKFSMTLFGAISFFLMVWIITPLSVYAQSDSTESMSLSQITDEAYIYTLPLFIMYKTRWQALVDPGPAVLNRFLHARKLATPASRAVTAPNNDTIYSSAWLDLSTEPLVVHVPDTAGRYYSLQFMDFYTNNFAYIGRRATGTREGDYIVIGPDYTNETPPGLPVIKSPTNAVWLLGRFLIDGSEDLSNVYKLQNQLSIKPLSSFMGHESKSSQAKQKPSLIRPEQEDPWNYLTIVNLALNENPPAEGDRGYIQKFKKIGIGPGLNFDQNLFSPKDREEILEGIKKAKDRLKSISKMRPRSRNGWNIPNPLLGDYGNNYFLRAIVAVVGLGALTREEAMYFRAIPEGEPFHGRIRYILHFEKDGLPPVNAFWSLTMYHVEEDMRSFLVENPINRYSVGDRTKGLKFNGDGSLDIYIQHESPGPDKESNWLPAPNDRFSLSLRAYQPRKELLEGRYLIPQIRRID